MYKKLEKLINVKSIVTLVLTLVYAIMVFAGKCELNNIYLMIVAFYFGTQHEKKGDKDND